MRTLKGGYDKILTLPAVVWPPSLIALECEAVRPWFYASWPERVTRLLLSLLRPLVAFQVCILRVHVNLAPPCVGTYIAYYTVFLEVNSKSRLVVNSHSCCSQVRTGDREKCIEPTANHMSRYQETNEPTTYLPITTDSARACACLYPNPLQAGKDKVILGFSLAF